LVGQKRPEEAKQSLRQLGVPNNVLQEEMAEAVLPSLHTVLDSRPSTAISSSSQLAKRVFLAWLLWLANLYASMSLIVWLPSILVRVYHHTIVDSLAYTLLITSCGFLGRIVGFYLLDKASRRFSLGYSLLLAAFCMFAISFIRNAHLALALAMLFYFFNEQSSVSQMAYIPELFPTKIRVRGNAWCSASARVVVATSPILIGYLLGNGHFQVIATILSMSLFIPWLVFVIWAPEMRGIGLSEITA
jgi:putative MFS transporter